MDNIKALIFTADDFGMSHTFNEAVLTGFQNGFLTSTCICANGLEFKDAVERILPQCSQIGLGIHLNIVEGRSTRKNISRTSLLCRSDRSYRYNFTGYLANSGNKRLLQEIEDDYRDQVEMVLKYSEADHLNSHVHTHAIPAIFEIVCKLAKEYNIPFVRTQYEKFYMIPDVLKHLNYWYPVNLTKAAVLNSMTKQNFKIAKKHDIRTNNYLIGVGYTGFMDLKTIEFGLKTIKDQNCITEILIHPNKNDNYSVKQNPRQIEFEIIQNMNLLKKIELMGWTLVNHKYLSCLNKDMTKNT